MVYNCNHVPALCATAARYLGAGVTTATFHYDPNSSRGDARRYRTCPTEGSNVWIDRIVNGGPRCPEPNQPAVWKHKGNVAGIATQMSIDPATNLASKNWLAQTILGVPPGSPPNTLPSQYQQDLPVRLSCDEFPAARYVSNH